MRLAVVTLLLLPVTSRAYSRYLWRHERPSVRLQSLDDKFQRPDSAVSTAMPANVADQQQDEQADTVPGRFWIIRSRPTFWISFRGSSSDSVQQATSSGVAEPSQKRDMEEQEQQQQQQEDGVYESQLPLVLPSPLSSPFFLRPSFMDLVTSLLSSPTYDLPSAYSLDRQDSPLPSSSSSSDNSEIPSPRPSNYRMIAYFVTRPTQGADMDDRRAEEMDEIKERMAQRLADAQYSSAIREAQQEGENEMMATRTAAPAASSPSPATGWNMHVMRSAVALVAGCTVLVIVSVLGAIMAAKRRRQERLEFERLYQPLLVNDAEGGPTAVLA